MKKIEQATIYFVTGSQHLYGEEVLKQVALDAQSIAKELDQSSHVPVTILYKGVVKGEKEIVSVCEEANNDASCIGVVFWMHTFSPAKMWIRGIQILNKPFAHLHTQFNREIPWSTIDMDYMNLHQSAHGGREFGFVVSRMKKYRYVIVGHYQDQRVQEELGTFTRVALAYNEAKHLKVARFGDNMRMVAVTEGDKVAALEQFGFQVDGYGIGDLVDYINKVGENDVDALVSKYLNEYDVEGETTTETFHQSLRNEAKIELGMRAFLEEGGYKAFTTTFEDLHGLPQLPGLAVQRLMADGYGFGAEGDWKTSALVRICKVLATGRGKGTSFMEDYTYNFSDSGDTVLGAHMLEVCPSIAKEKPLLRVKPLGIGGKADPVRLIFKAKTGPALNATLLDLGNRFRLLVNTLESVDVPHELPLLPVAHVLWRPEPNLTVSAASWIYAGGAHHSVFSLDIDEKELEILSNLWGIEFTLIDKDTNVRRFNKELAWSDSLY